MSAYLKHHGILGQKWGVRRYQNEDGTLTAAGKKHLGIVSTQERKQPEGYNGGIAGSIKEHKKVLSKIAGAGVKKDGASQQMTVKDYLGYKQVSDRKLLKDIKKTYNKHEEKGYTDLGKKLDALMGDDYYKAIDSINAKAAKATIDEIANKYGSMTQRQLKKIATSKKTAKFMRGFNIYREDGV